MAGLPSIGGEAKPYVGYAGKQGTWFVVNEKVKTPVNLVEFVIDLENFATGWGKFADAQAPEWVMNADKYAFGPIPNEAVDKDGKKVWKKGVRVTFYSPGTFGGDGVRAFDTTAFGAYEGISRVLSKYLEQAASHPGQVPVVKYVGFENHGTGQKSTTIPKFEIVKFIPRPAALTAGATAPVAANQPVAQAALAAAGNEF